ncbi:MAG: preprotein translocase subunit SecG [Synergistaceae bacterium]|nr:preprotein translocase subunit SecG [Synergistaceae bacterium]MBQ7193710.1 preprotein translocase subunit SecG [Synergistaceae bacterium]MBQ7267078.1 preprotein translocase subunit SecG [Synergistaceae bacterium]
MRAVLALIHIVVSVMMIFVVLIQQRKQGGFSGVFGGGTQADTGQWQRFSSLTKLTVILSIVFMITSFLIVFLN